MKTILKSWGLGLVCVALSACGTAPAPVINETLVPTSSTQPTLMPTDLPASTLTGAMSTPSPTAISTAMVIPEFSFDQSEVSKAPTKTTFLVRQGFALDDLVSASTSCGNNLTKEHFATVLKTFAPTDVANEYHFVFNGASQSPNEWVVTAMPNKLNYESESDFKQDFDICEAGAGRYPFKVSPSYLLFTSSCGSGYSDGSGLPNGCQKVKDAIEPSLSMASRVVTASPVASAPSSSEVAPQALYTNSEYGFSMDFGSWGVPKVTDVTATYKETMPVKSVWSFVAANGEDRVITLYAVPLNSQEDPAITDAPMTLVKKNASYAFFYSSSGDYTDYPGMDDPKWDTIYRESKQIIKTFKLL